MAPRHAPWPKTPGGGLIIFNGMTRFPSAGCPLLGRPAISISYFYYFYFQPPCLVRVRRRGPSPWGTLTSYLCQLAWRTPI
jgi:hypothetical protein